MKNYSLFPPAVSNVVIHSSLISYILAAIAGYGPLTGFAITRTNSSAVSVAAGTYSNGAKLKSIIGATALGSIPLASAGKQRYDAIVIDCDTDTVIRVTGTEGVPDDEELFLENESPKPPSPADQNWAVLYFLRITETGLDDITIGDYCTHGIADVKRPQAFAVDGTTIDVAAATGVMSIVQSGVDHGSIGGLADDDHSQYLTTGRHDVTTRHTLGTVVPHDDHGALAGLGDDDHTQYLLRSILTTRGDVLFQGASVAARLAAATSAEGAFLESHGSSADPTFTLINHGWFSANETWTYASANTNQFTLTIPGDKTLKYSEGMKIALVQGGVTKFFFITNVLYSSTNTTLTLYGGTDYVLTSGAITNPSYSTAKSPWGFPMNPEKWSVIILASATAGDTPTPAQSTWYNTGSKSISIPIGTWLLRFTTEAMCVWSSTVWSSVYACLSTSNNSTSDPQLHAYANGSAFNAFLMQLSSQRFVSLSDRTVYYLNFSHDCPSIPTHMYQKDNENAKIIEAICAYCL